MIGGSTPSVTAGLSPLLVWNENSTPSQKNMRLYLLLSVFSLALHVLSLPVPGGSDGDAQDLIYREETDFDFGERGFGDEGLYDLEERSAQPSIDNSEPSVYRKETSISGEGGLQPRAAGAIIEGVQMLVEGIMAIVNHIKEKVQHDKNVSELVLFGVRRLNSPGAQ